MPADPLAAVRLSGQQCLILSVAGIVVWFAAALLLGTLGLPHLATRGAWKTHAGWQPRHVALRSLPPGAAYAHAQRLSSPTSLGLSLATRL